MKIPLFGLMLWLLTITVGLCSAESSIVNDGFARFKTSGAAPAVEVWSKQSKGLAPERLQELRAGLSETEKHLGSCLGYEIMLSRDLGGGSTLVWISSRFQYGTVFFRFLVFRDTLGVESINSIKGSEDPLEIFPESYWRGK